MPIEFRILGPLEIVAGGRAVPLGSPKQRALLGLLLVHANETVSRDRLIGELWPEPPPPTVESALHVYLSRLRRLLESGGAEGALVREAHGYRLRIEPEQLDANSFETLVRDGSEELAAGNAEVAAERLRQALALWRGPALADLQGEQFAVTAAARLEEERVSALERRLEADLALGRHHQLIGELEALASEHPYRERLRAQLMVALYRSGRQAEALRAYQDARRTFAEDLGLEPSSELRELEQAILRQDGLPGTRSYELVPDARPRSTRYRRPILVAAVVVAVLVSVAAAGVVAIRAGADASLRIPPNSVGFIDPASNKVKGVVRVGIEPGPVAIGAGTVWVGNAGDRSLTRIDAASHEVAHNVALAATPTGVSVTPGAVWVVLGQLGVVARVDPQFNRVVETIDPKVGRSSGGAIDARQGAVWVTFAGHTIAYVGRIDPRSSRVTAEGYPGGAPSAIAVGEGAVWVANGADSNSISRVHPQTATAVETVPVGRGPRAIAAGAGAVWVANSSGDSVTRFDPVASSQSTIRVGDTPSAIAVGAGAVWVANAGDGTVMRIDPSTRDVTKTIKVGGRPEGLAVGAGAVWVAVQAANA